jgi:hypothetical protein
MWNVYITRKGVRLWYCVDEVAAMVYFSGEAADKPYIHAFTSEAKAQRIARLHNGGIVKPSEQAPC